MNRSATSCGFNSDTQFITQFQRWLAATGEHAAEAPRPCPKPGTTTNITFTDSLLVRPQKDNYRADQTYPE